MSRTQGADTSVVSAMWSTFARAGLAAPPVPRTLGGRLRAIGDWHWSTRTDDGDPVGHEAGVERLVRSRVDELTVAHSGHGLNSWAIHYQLRLGPLAVALQIPWGNAYGDPDEAARDVADRFDEARELIGTLRDDAAERLDGKLVVVSLSGWTGEWGAVVDQGESARLPHPVVGSAHRVLAP